MTIQTATRFSTYYDHVLYPIDRRGFGIFDVYAQAKEHGGKFTRIVNGLPKGSIANFSPSVIKYKDNTYIAWRSQPEPFGFRYDMKYFYLNGRPTEIHIGALANDETIIGTQKLRNKPHRLSYEDPRLFVGPDKEMYVQFVGSTYASKFDSNERKLFHKPKVVVCYLNEQLEAVSAAIPPIGKNRQNNECEKNWGFFSHNDELHCLYSTIPLVIERENGKPITINSDVLKHVTGGAPTNNSTAPLDIGDSYLVFYHWKFMVPVGERPVLVYCLGSYLLNKKLSRITHADPKPLFVGDPHDKLIQWTDVWGSVVSSQPALMLPFSAITENDELVMALGINDSYMGIFRCPMSNILSRMQKVN